MKVRNFHQTLFKKWSKIFFLNYRSVGSFFLIESERYTLKSDIFYAFFKIFEIFFQIEFCAMKLLLYIFVNYFVGSFVGIYVIEL